MAGEWEIESPAPAVMAEPVKGVEANEATSIADVMVLRAKNNRIQVSANKKPLFYYVNLAKRIIQRHNEVVLSALGMAIGVVVTVTEILKTNGLATAKTILISTIDAQDRNKSRLVQKAKIEILLIKSENFAELVNAGKLKGCKPEKDEIE